MKKYFLFALVLFFTSEIYGQQNIQALLQPAFEKAYNFEFDAAERAFNKIIERSPHQPAGYYGLAKIHLWIYLATKDPGEYYIFLKYSDLAQDYAEKILEAEPKSAQMNFLLSDLLTLKAMAHATNNNGVDALWASKNAVSYAEETLELDPRFYEAYLPLGLFDYAMGFVPDFFRWAVNLTGLSSDKKRGLEYLQKAYKRGHYLRPEAEFHLAKIYTDYLAEYDSAAVYLKDLSARYPKNTLVLYQYAVTLIKSRKLDRANEVLNNLLRVNNKRMIQINSLAYFRKGEISFRKNQFKNAITHLQTFLETNRELDFSGIANYWMSICYKSLGDDANSQKHLLEARNGNVDVFEDSYAKVRSEIYFNRGFSPADLRLLRMKNNLEAGKFTVVADSLKNPDNAAYSQDQKGLAYAMLADAYLHLGKYKLAVDNAEPVDKLDLQNEKWVLPFSLYIRARANYLVGETDGAFELLEKAEDGNVYDFKDNIQALIENLRRRIDRK